MSDLALLFVAAALIVAIYSAVLPAKKDPVGWSVGLLHALAALALARACQQAQDFSFAVAMGTLAMYAAVMGARPVMARLNARRPFA